MAPKCGLRFGLNQNSHGLLLRVALEHNAMVGRQSNATRVLLYCGHTPIKAHIAVGQNEWLCFDLHPRAIHISASYGHPIWLDPKRPLIAGWLWGILTLLVYKTVV